METDYLGFLAEGKDRNEAGLLVRKSENARSYPKLLELEEALGRRLGAPGYELADMPQPSRRWLTAHYAANLAGAEELEAASRRFELLSLTQQELLRKMAALSEIPDHELATGLRLEPQRLRELLAQIGASIGMPPAPHGLVATAVMAARYNPVTG